MSDMENFALFHLCSLYLNIIDAGKIETSLGSVESLPEICQVLLKCEL